MGAEFKPIAGGSWFVAEDFRFEAGVDGFAFAGNKSGFFARRKGAGVRSLQLAGFKPEIHGGKPENGILHFVNKFFLSMFRARSLTDASRHKTP